MTVGGAAVGGVVGYYLADKLIGGESAEIIGPTAGEIIGGFLGNEIAKHLDAQDRESDPDVAGSFVEEAAASDLRKPYATLSNCRRRDTGGKLI